jgi:hypothetical protein
MEESEMNKSIMKLCLLTLLGLIFIQPVVAQDDGDALIKKWEKEVFTDKAMLYAIGKEEGMMQVARGMSVNTARVELSKKVEAEQKTAADFLKDQFKTDPTRVTEAISNLKLENIELSEVKVLDTQCFEGSRPGQVVCYSAVQMPRAQVDQRIDQIIRSSADDEVVAIWTQHRNNPF